MLPLSSPTTLTGEELVKWAELESRALIGEYSWAVRDPLDAVHMPTAQLFIDDDKLGKGKAGDKALAAALAPFNDVARRFRGRIAFLYMKAVRGMQMSSPISLLLRRRRRPFAAAGHVVAVAQSPVHFLPFYLFRLTVHHVVHAG